MTSECERVAGSEIPYFNGSINAPARHDVRIVVETNNAFRMPFQCTYTLARPPVPYADCMIHAAGDQLHLIKLQRPDSACVAFQTRHLHPSLKVPYTGCAI